jgi:hypothetical protein
MIAPLWGLTAAKRISNENATPPGVRLKAMLWRIMRFLTEMQKRPGKSPAVYSEKTIRNQRRYFAAVGSGTGLSANVCR